MDDDSTARDTARDTTKRTNLGRGLAALFGEESDDYASLDKVRTAKPVPIEHLHPNRFQPRQDFAPEALKSLSDSIAANGILQPILVRRHAERASEFEIIAGERRWRAAQMAKIHEIPVVIRDFTDAQALEAAIVENVQRQDLTAIEEAMGYQRLMAEFKHTQEDIAGAVGKSRSHIANTVRLLSLPEAVQAMLGSGEISAGHARALIGAPDPESLARRIAAEGLTVRQAERLARGEGEPSSLEGKSARGKGKAPALPKDPDTIALERDLTALLGLRVAIEFHGQGGSLTVHYQTLEQLDDVLHRLNQMPPGEPQ
ncbi:MAG: ParB/RepB/Spo0J family partition protein [Alphaproteobacteria bacterium]